MASTSEILRISGGMTFPQVINRVKPRLAQDETVEMHAIGRATATLSIAIERLVTLGYATLNSISTELVTDQGRAVKIVASIKKAPTFEKASEEFTSRETEETKEK